jgi:hypothetical protein
VLLFLSVKNLIDFPQSRWVQFTLEVGEQSLKAKGRRQASGFTFSTSSGELCPPVHGVNSLSPTEGDRIARSGANLRPRLIAAHIPKFTRPFDEPALPRSPPGIARCLTACLFRDRCGGVDRGTGLSKTRCPGTHHQGNKICPIPDSNALQTGLPAATPKEI